MIFFPVLLSLLGTEKVILWLPQKYKYTIGLENK